MIDIDELLNKAMPHIANRIQNELILMCPVDTGLLRNSIRVRPTEKGLIIVMNDYGKFVEFGTSPHTIEAKNKESLAFEWTEVDGQMVGRKGRLEKKMSKSQSSKAFYKKVKHPGTRPNPFIRNTLQNKLGKIIAEEIEKLL